MQHLPAVSNVRNVWIFVCIQEFLSHTVGEKNYNKKFFPKGLPATDIYAYKVAYCSYAPLWRHDNWTVMSELNLTSSLLYVHYIWNN